MELPIHPGLGVLYQREPETFTEKMRQQSEHSMWLAQSGAFRVWKSLLAVLAPVSQPWGLTALGLGLPPESLLVEFV